MCDMLYLKTKSRHYVNIINLLLDINNFLQNSRLNIIQLRVKVFIEEHLQHVRTGMISV